MPQVISPRKSSFCLLPPSGEAFPVEVGRILMGRCDHWRVYPHGETVPHWYLSVAGKQPEHCLPCWLESLSLRWERKLNGSNAFVVPLFLFVCLNHVNL